MCAPREINEPVHISAIDVDSKGKFERRFREDFAPLTLVYARNEAGKTTITENIIASLFKAPWEGGKLRDDFIGASNITVTGLAAKPSDFSPEGKEDKLEDLLLKNEEGELPPGLCKLLYVRSADTDIDAHRGGIAKDTLKELLFTQQLQMEIPKEVKDTEFEDGVLQPTTYRSGMCKILRDMPDKVDKLRELARRFHAQQSEVGLIRHKLERRSLEQEQAELEKAKRHHAYKLDAALKDIRGSRARLDAAVLDKLADRIPRYAGQSDAAAERERQIKGYGAPEKELAWLKAAREKYLEAGVGKSRDYLAQLLAATIASLLLIGVLALIKPSWVVPFMLLPLVLSATAAWRYSTRRATVKDKAAEARQEKVAKEYRKRYGADITSEVDFDVKEKDLEKQANNKETAIRDRDKALAISRELAAEIEGLFGQVLETAPRDSDKWSAALKELEQKGKSLDLDANDARNKLEVLRVSPSDYQQEKAGAEYSASREEDLGERIISLDRQIEQEKGKLGSIRKELSGRIGDVAHTGSPEDVVAAMDETLRGYEEELLETRATLIAGHFVKRVRDALQSKDDAALERHLAGPEIAGLVKAFTDGAYDRVEVKGDGVLACRGEKVRYEMANLSRGAQEQVLLALRIGIARKLTGKDRLFIILDDAFQYSDWERRAPLVEKMADLARDGWQVIYFTMDDDIRDRFNQVGKQLGKDYKYIELK